MVLFKQHRLGSISSPGLDLVVLTILFFFLLPSAFGMVQSEQEAEVVKSDPSPLGAAAGIADKPEETIRVDVTIRDAFPIRGTVGVPADLPVRFVAEAAVGNVDAGKTYKLELTILNTASIAFPFDGVSPSCHCSRGGFQTREFLPGQPAKGSIEMRVSADRLTDEIGFEFYQNRPEGRREHVGSIRLTISLRGVLAFNSPKKNLIAVNELNEYSFPLLLTEPVRLENVEVSVSEGLEPSTVSVYEVDGTGHVRLRVPLAIVPDNGLFGEIIAHEKATNAKTGVRISIHREKPYSFSPGIIRFQEVDGKFMANALLRINEKNESNETITASGFTTRIVDLDNAEIGLVVSEIATGIYRLRFEADRAAGESAEKRLVMGFRLGSGLVVQDVPFVFPQKKMNERRVSVYKNNGTVIGDFIFGILRVGQRQCDGWSDMFHRRFPAQLPQHCFSSPCSGIMWAVYLRGYLR